MWSSVLHQFKHFQAIKIQAAFYRSVAVLDVLEEQSVQILDTIDAELPSYPGHLAIWRFGEEEYLRTREDFVAMIELARTTNTTDVSIDVDKLSALWPADGKTWTPSQIMDPPPSPQQGF